MKLVPAVLGLLLSVLSAAACGQNGAAVGLIELPATGDSVPVTVLYPAHARSVPIQRDALTVSVAADASPEPDIGRLIVISHGSPASPWVYFHLAQSLVNAGFTVAFPEHFADNARNSSEPGPPSWRRRPQEVSKAIDRVQADERFARHLDFANVGMYGMSAGGHTALTLAGGRWSPSRLREHCQNHLDDDFVTCAGPSVELTGGMFDGAKKAIIRAINGVKFNDATWHSYREPRITTIIAGVPFAVDFDGASFAKLHARLGIISARKDRWLAPKYHSDFVLAHCTQCTLLLDLPTGGHGALLSPMFPNLTARSQALVGDPPGFDRAAVVPGVNATITRFFLQHLAAHGE